MSNWKFSFYLLASVVCLDTNGHAASLDILAASPDAPQLDVIVNGQIIDQFVPFRQLTVPVSIPDGMDTIKVNVTGTTTTLINTTIDVSAGQSYTLVAGNTVARLAPTLLVNPVAADPANASLQLLPEDPTTSAVFWQVASGATLAGSVAYNTLSAAVTLAPGPTVLQIGAAGSNTVLAQGTAQLAAGSANLIGVLGVAGASGDLAVQVIPYNLTGVPIPAGSQTATVSFTNAIAAAPGLDFYLGSSGQVSPTANFVPFRQTTGAVTVPAGSYFVQANLANTSTQVVSTGSPSSFPQSFTAGGAYSAVLVGSLASPQVVVFSDQTTTLPGLAALRVLNLSPDAPALDIKVEGGPTLATALTYLGDGGYIDLSPGMDQIDVFASGTNTLLFSKAIDLVAGHDYSFDVEGLISGSAQLQQQLQGVLVDQSGFNVNEVSSTAVAEPASIWVFASAAAVFGLVGARRRASKL